MNGRIDPERILDAFLAPEADRIPDRVIDAALADVARTPQRRAPRVPWRFPNVSNLSSTARAVLVGAVLLVALVGATYLVGGSRPPPRPADVPPTSAATPSPSPLPTGITGWTDYTSKVHGFSLRYPEDWSVNAPATRTWQAGDTIFGVDEWPFAETFASPDSDPVGLSVWEMPAGEGADLDSISGLGAWARQFCVDIAAPSCEEFTGRPVPMCLDTGGESCRAAIIVPTAGQQYAFFMDWSSVILVDAPDKVQVVVVSREDAHPAAARYGGSVALLKAILTTMDVWTPGQGPVS